jgi:two-component system KDP operon response regulator KdpE
MTSLAPNILVVEDEAHIRGFVKLALESEGFLVIEAETAMRGLADASSRRPDLILLDMGLPDRDGQEFIMDVRAWSDIPIIVLSARIAETEKVSALNAGADDYLTKPFGTAELLARVRAHLRRRLNATGKRAHVKFGSIQVDLESRTVLKEGMQLHLTPIEFKLLGYLIANPGRVLTHRQLLKDIWGPSHTQDAHYVRVFMGQLRKKIEAIPSRPQFILTESGIGYRFNGLESDESETKPGQP